MNTFRSSYWDRHEYGTYGRPRPGTLVTIVNGPYTGQTGVVEPYDGSGTSTAVHVRQDNGLTLSYLTEYIEWPGKPAVTRAVDIETNPAAS